MLLPRCSFLPLLLVVLQFFAPLLHAHTTQRDPHFGLHIPGLEAYGAPAGSTIASQSETGCTAAADCIVAVDDGFREKTSPSTATTADGGKLPLPAGLFFLAAAPRAKFSQPPLPPSRPRSPSPAAPRAPPAI